MWMVIVRSINRSTEKYSRELEIGLVLMRTKINSREGVEWVVYLNKILLVQMTLLIRFGKSVASCDFSGYPQ